MTNKINAVLGLQWGDEGKGKLVDSLMQSTDLCCRFNGGSNAGHTIVADGKKYALHLLPSGILNPKAINFLGNGVVCHIKTVLRELEQFGDENLDVLQRLFISSRCTIVLDLHQLVDGVIEASLAEDKKIGTTKRGIGPTYTSKIARTGIRFADLFHPETFAEKVRALHQEYIRAYGTLEAGKAAFAEYRVEEEIKRHIDEYFPLIKKQIKNGAVFIKEALQSNLSILAEGANAVMLDIDHGTYPFVTSSSTVSGGICTGLAVPPALVGDVFGVVKAYTTRVGEGPFPTEDHGDDGDRLRRNGHEYGTTTGRPRRCGWLDLGLLRYSCFLNGVTHINLTKVDVLTGFESIKVAKGYKFKDTDEELPDGYFPSDVQEIDTIEPVYIELPGWSEDICNITNFEDLPANCQNYVLYIEQELGIPVKWLGNGPGRTDLIIRHST